MHNTLKAFADQARASSSGIVKRLSGTKILEARTHDAVGMITLPLGFWPSVRLVRIDAGSCMHVVLVLVGSCFQRQLDQPSDPVQARQAQLSRHLAHLPRMLVAPKTVRHVMPNLWEKADQLNGPFFLPCS
jgi:hypothetical protein